MSNEGIVTIGLLGLGVYFSVLMARGLLGYFRFWKVKETAVVVWPGRPPSHLGLLLLLGVLSGILAVVLSMLDRPFHHVYSQGVMALYFILMVPLSARIHLGLYRDGVWSDGGFVRYADIERMAFFENPEIVLILVPRGRSGSLRLPVPPGEYGAVRKILEEKRRAHIVNLDRGLLGLDSGASGA